MKTYFRRELPGLKNEKNPILKCFLYFGTWNFLAPGLKTYIPGGTSKAPKTKIYYTSPKKVINKFFYKHFWIIVPIFSINGIKQYYWYIKALKYGFNFFYLFFFEFIIFYFFSEGNLQLQNIL